MQPISATSSASSAAPTIGVSNAQVLGMVGGISKALISSGVRTDASSVTISQTSLTSALSGSVGALMTKSEDEKKEDWMEELTEQQSSKSEESHQLMKSMAKDKGNLGDLGVPVPGLHSDALKHFVC